MALGLALVSMVLSLLLYEAHIGLAALLTVLCLFLSRGTSLSRRLVGMLPFVLAVIFALGRWRAQLAVSSVYGYATESLELTPLVLMTRLVAGYDCSLVRCWVVNAGRLIPALRSAGGARALTLGLRILTTRATLSPS